MSFKKHYGVAFDFAKYFLIFLVAKHKSLDINQFECNFRNDLISFVFYLVTTKWTKFQNSI